MNGDCVGLTRQQTNKPGFVPGFFFWYRWSLSAKTL